MTDDGDDDDEEEEKEDKTNQMRGNTSWLLVSPLFFTIHPNQGNI